VVATSSGDDNEWVFRWFFLGLFGFFLSLQFFVSFSLFSLSFFFLSYFSFLFTSLWFTTPSFIAQNSLFSSFSFLSSTIY